MNLARRDAAGNAPSGERAGFRRVTSDFLTPEETALFTSDEVGSIAVWTLCESFGEWQDGYDLERAAAEHTRPEVLAQAIATVRRIVADVAAHNAAKRCTDETSEAPRIGENDRTEPLCACGRVVSLCDGSRRGCNPRSAS